MQVILVKDVPNLGSIGDLVNVKNGYFTNYLFPKKLAILASVNNKRRLEHEKRLASHQLEKAREAAKSTAEQLKGQPVVIARKAGEQDKLFGSVTAQDIARALEERGIVVDRRKITLDEPIKELGEFTVPVKLSGDLAGEIKLQVVAE